MCHLESTGSPSTMALPAQCRREKYQLPTHRHIIFFAPPAFNSPLCSHRAVPAGNTTTTIDNHPILSWLVRKWYLWHQAGRRWGINLWGFPVPHQCAQGQSSSLARQAHSPDWYSCQYKLLYRCPQKRGGTLRDRYDGKAPTWKIFKANELQGSASVHTGSHAGFEKPSCSIPYNTQPLVLKIKCIYKLLHNWDLSCCSYTTEINWKHNTSLPESKTEAQMANALHKWGKGAGM